MRLAIKLEIFHTDLSGGEPGVALMMVLLNEEDGF